MQQSSNDTTDQEELTEKCLTCENVPVGLKESGQ